MEIDYGIRKESKSRNFNKTIFEGQFHGLLRRKVSYDMKCLQRGTVQIPI